jgi:hypothetical protein
MVTINNKKMVNVRVDYDLYKAFRLKAVELDTNMTEVIIAAMKEYLNLK